MFVSRVSSIGSQSQIEFAIECSCFDYFGFMNSEKTSFSIVSSADCANEPSSIGSCSDFCAKTSCYQKVRCNRIKLLVFLVILRAFVVKSSVIVG